MINNVVLSFIIQGFWCFWNRFVRAVDVAVSDALGIDVYALAEDLKLAQASP